MIFIDAIVPVYNVEPYLRECIDSLINQTISFHKIILINDGSTDRSGKICEEYCDRYDFIKLINQDNRGLGAARNVGIRNSQADYVVFVDSDDFVSDRMVERICSELKEEKVDMLIYSAGERYDIDSAQKPGYFKHSDFLNGKTMNGFRYIKEAFPRNYIISACIAAYRRRFLLDNRIFFPERLLHEDHFFNMQVWINANKMRYIGDSLYIRRYRENSITTSEYSRKRCQDLIDGKILEWNYIRERQKKIEPWIIRIFVLQETAKILDMLKENSRPEWKMAEQLQELFFTYWISFLEKELSWSESYLVLQIINVIPNDFSDIKYKGLNRKRLIGKYKEILKAGIKDRLKQISLCEGKVGIYGVGAHTELLLDCYQRYIGDWDADLFFVVTKLDGRGEYRGREIISCDRLTNDVDYIIVSSLVYQEDMVANLKKVGIDNDKIITLYGSNEVCDITQANALLLEK